MDYEKNTEKPTRLSRIQQGYQNLAKEVPFAGKEEKYFSIENLAEEVKSPKSDDLAKYLMRSFLTIDGKEFNTLKDIDDILYTNIRYDSNSIGEINNNNEVRNDWDRFTAKVKNDCQTAEQYHKIAHTQPGFLHFKSWNIYGGDKIPSREQLHRVYINSKADNLMKFVDATYDQLKEDKIPFYFKIHTASEAEKGPKDSFVLYTSSTYLEKTIKALERVESKYPSVIKNLNNPSELVGRISRGWIGYASEKEENPQDSYTGYICKAFIDAMEEHLNQWVENHPKTLMTNGNTVGAYWEKNRYTFQQEKYEARQYLLNRIPRIDHTFAGQFCEAFRRKLSENDFNPDNIALTPYAERDAKAHSGA